jgi:ribosomal protein S19E (S16A)
MATWYSERFRRNVRVTRHASSRMAERSIEESLLQDLVETGLITAKDECRLWVHKHYHDRDDNLICAAVVLEAEVVVKTVMHRWKRMEPRP